MIDQQVSYGFHSTYEETIFVRHVQINGEWMVKYSPMVTTGDISTHEKRGSDYRRILYDPSSVNLDVSEENGFFICRVKRIWSLLVNHVFHDLIKEGSCIEERKEPLPRWTYRTGNTQSCDTGEGSQPVHLALGSPDSAPFMLFFSL